ncbi:L-seryl-tRNA(Sec) selenium transferase [Desulfuromusa kysingii]|uniref:L-seryl-tRNA(Sec) selenium transferase n=1 Tax=Desulfuromusa kysingii TaxID=37625 RepID=A0A1H4C5C8_9BACT|nr:L-seryl-tRNA(Sec) selenium transferase [Desulfuromusa kysingii]SEA55503.1 L-seryl-tRNA(Sec) selenium transferase [Desulfuromusa kysingii]
MSGRQDLLRTLPAIDRILREESMQDLAQQLPQDILSQAVQELIASLRQEILNTGESIPPERLHPSSLAAVAAAHCRKFLQPSLRKVINATGTLLHTNLGRAPLSLQSIEAINDVAVGYSNLEFELDSGKRGERFSHVESLLQQLTGAEAALVVNNNSGAVLLALAALGKGREAIVSRGELVEIGGAFRIPEVMEAGGVILREVGSSNRTHLRDYQQAITAETAILLKVHTSNYRIVGFTKEVTARELLPVAREHDLILMEDLGSGLLLDLSGYGLEREPTVPEVVKAGVDVITFSGDKLLGGPQAGLIVGRADLIKKIRKHPLARALRIDKLTLAALESTLRLYLQPEQALRELPVLKMFSADPEEQKQRCQRLYERLKAESLAAEIALIEDVSRVGGGAMPLTELTDWAVEINPSGKRTAELAKRLRAFTPAVVVRVQNDRLLVNLRAVFAEEEAVLTQILITILKKEG